MSQKSGVYFPVVELRSDQKQQQIPRLIMSAHMQQALHMLQLPVLELGPYITEQAMQNPLLEIVEEEGKQENQEEVEANSVEAEVSINENDFDILKHLDEDFQELWQANDSLPIKRSIQEESQKTYLESSILAEVSLQDHLNQQAQESFDEPRDLEVAKILIGYIESTGFLNHSLEEIQCLYQLDKDQLMRVLGEIQKFEPYGVGAASIQETLLIQLRCLKKEKTLAYQIIDQCYQDLLHHRLHAIQKRLKFPLLEIQTAIEKEIARLDLHPGIQFSSQMTQTLVPDVLLRQEDEQLIVEINRDWEPRLRFNRRYLKMLEDPTIPLETKKFIRQHIFSARWLTRNLQQRYSTIERIAASLAKRHYEFFTQPDGKLIPLTMRVLAEELEVHESTIARTVSNKYLFSPRGLMPLRSFFTTGYQLETGEDLSAKTVKDVVLEIINQEDKCHPLSDEKISLILKERGIPCARRTVAKYRAAFHIGNTLQRRRFT